MLLSVIQARLNLYQQQYDYLYTFVFHVKQYFNNNKSQMSRFTFGRMKMASTATVPIDEQKIKHLKSFERHLWNLETPDALKIEL